MNISDLFDNFEVYAFRLETLPRYDVQDETDAIEHFTKHGTLPAGHNADWAEFISGTVEAGKRMERLRLFTVPLTDYEKFERVVYEINIEAGEDIHAADLADFQPPTDFWAFDDRWIARMIYDEAGKWHGADVTEMTDNDRAEVAHWREVYASTPSIRIAFPLK